MSACGTARHAGPDRRILTDPVNSARKPRWQPPDSAADPLVRLSNASLRDPAATHRAHEQPGRSGAPVEFGLDHLQHTGGAHRVELVGRVRGDRVMRLPEPPRVYDSKGGRAPKRGPEFRFAKPDTWPHRAVTARTATANYGKTPAQA